MSRGRLIRPMKATFAQLDTVAIEAATNFDDDFGEVKKVDTDADGIGETQRLEKAELVVLNVQVESSIQEQERQKGTGDDPKSVMTLVAHMKELEELGLVAADGRIALAVNDRLVKIEDQFGIVVHTADRVPLFVTQVKRIDGWLGFKSNLAMITVNERIKGIA